MPIRGELSGAAVRGGGDRWYGTLGHAAGSEKPASASDIVGCTLVVAHFWSTSVSAYSGQDRESDGSQCEAVGLPGLLPHTVWH